jgi:hypothetical protein
MRKVRRYLAFIPLGDASHEIEAVLASDYDALAAELADLKLHFDTLKADRDQQYDMKRLARIQRDAVTAANQRLREALNTAMNSMLDSGYSSGSVVIQLCHAALTTAKCEVTE